MSQNDFNLGNQGFPSMRADMNSAYQALATKSSGANAPSTTYSNQWWYDETNSVLKIRNPENTAWITFMTFDSGTSEYTIPPSAIEGVGASAAQINTAATHYVPTGGIILWSGSVLNIPTGWTLCDGTDSTPDLRDRFVVGAGSAYGVGDTGGTSTVTLTESQMPTHNHYFSGTTNTTGEHVHTYMRQNAGRGAAGNDYTVLTGAGNYVTTSSGNHNHTVSGNTGDAGSGSAHENRPPYYALAYIMKT
jgi:microcystin-dependent protein